MADLTDAQSSAVYKLLMGLMKPGKACPVCGSSAWILVNAVMKKPAADFGRPMPIVVLVCVNCKYNLDFSAVGLGIVDSSMNVIIPGDPSE